MKTIPIVALAGAIAIGAAHFGGCKGDQSRREEVASGVREPDSAAKPAQSEPPAAGNNDASAVRTYSFHGKPVKIDEATGTVTIDHEKIEGYMDAMTMPYKVADPGLLKQMTVGKETHFTIRVAGDQALVTKVEESHAAGAEH